MGLPSRIARYTCIDTFKSNAESQRPARAECQSVFEKPVQDDGGH